MNNLPKLAPHLVVKGGLAAIKFYEEAFDADTQFLMMAEDGKRVMHAALEVNDSIIYLWDDFRAGSKPAAKQPAVPDGAVVMIHLQLKKPKHVDAIMQQAVAHGAEIAMPAEDAFWGDRYGQIRDPFGHMWTFGAALKHKGEMQAEMVKAPPSAKASIPKNRGRGSKSA
jgi:PhnB protein